MQCKYSSPSYSRWREIKKILRCYQKTLLAVRFSTVIVGFFSAPCLFSIWRQLLLSSSALIFCLTLQQSLFAQGSQSSDSSDETTLDDGDDGVEDSVEEKKETIKEDVQEEAAQEQEEEKPEEKPEVIASKESAEESAEEPARKGRIFGSYDLCLAMNRPQFTNIQSVYDKHYSKPSDFFSIGVDWYPWDFFVTMGLGLRAGVYSDTGYTSNEKLGDDKNADSLTINEDSKSNLLFAPIAILLKAQATPFAKKWIKLSGWVGLEQTYWRESKLSQDTDSTKSSAAPASSDKKSLTTSGARTALVTGGAVHFLLSYLDEQSSNSMRDTLGMQSIYLTLQVEMLKDRSTEGLDLSRNQVALAFTFETVR